MLKTYKLTELARNDTWDFVLYVLQTSQPGKSSICAADTQQEYRYVYVLIFVCWIINSAVKRKVISEVGTDAFPPVQQHFNASFIFYSYTTIPLPFLSPFFFLMLLILIFVTFFLLSLSVSLPDLFLLPIPLFKCPLEILLRGQSIKRALRAITH